MTPDPKWLEVLKASGPQFACVAIALGLMLYADIHGSLPIALDETWRRAVLVTAVACGGLAVSAVATSTSKALKSSIHSSALRIRAWRFSRNEYRKFLENISYLPDKDKEILGWLAWSNQQYFTCQCDGGFATRLISMGVIESAARPSQIFLQDSMPFRVSEMYWKLLIEHKESFPKPNLNEAPPWLDNGWI